MKKDEMQDFIKNISEIKKNNLEDFLKIKYIVEGILLTQKTNIGSVEKSR